ncbi:MAG: hypothetical protein HW384_1044 [Dehalococcoidia bacterium]|nr:hypothetical protein [Dehalococcoidia bacterium]MBF8303800.1 hypothetical protein [Dehalococcoidia bacterium]
MGYNGNIVNKTAKLLMVQGTSSSVGKSMLVTALCHIFHQDGWKVAPFKSQNMALNSFVTRDGGEIGRSQATQAEAAGVEPTVDMNPILLKPEADSRSQVVVLGKPWITVPAGEYYRYTSKLLKTVKTSLHRLQSEYDIVVIEGAGGPAEVNLKRHEITNMRIARYTNCPVLLVGDIERGGVFASIVGTLTLLTRTEKKLVRGFVINKFRGDINILKPGLEFLEKRTKRPVLGVLPYIQKLFLPEEDSLREDIDNQDTVRDKLDIVVIALPRISNATDFEPLHQEPDVNLRYVQHPSELRNPDVIILPGTKSTMADLAFIRNNGLDKAITLQAQQRTAIIGVCGGFQMLGQRILDPAHVESSQDSVEGLALLQINTAFFPEKTTRQVEATVVAEKGILTAAKGQRVTGYEIHMGQSRGDEIRPAFMVNTGGTAYPDGAISEDGRIAGTYLHGLFDNYEFRRAFLDNLRREKGFSSLARQALLTRQQQFDKLADLVRNNLDMEKIYTISGLR